MEVIITVEELTQAIKNGIRQANREMEEEYANQLALHVLNFFQLCSKAIVKFRPDILRINPSRFSRLNPRVHRVKIRLGAHVPTDLR